MSVSVDGYEPGRAAWPIDDVTIGVKPPARTRNPAPRMRNGSTVREVLGFTDAQRQEEYAFHEAGHVVMYLAARIPIISAQISPEHSVWGDPDSLHAGIVHARDENAEIHDQVIMYAGGERAGDRWLRERGLWTSARAWEHERAADTDRQNIAHLCRTRRAEIPSPTAQAWGIGTSATRTTWRIVPWLNDGSTSRWWPKPCWPTYT